MTAYYAAGMFYTTSLRHHGILGQKWGKRNGPPYPLNPEDHSKAERKAGWENSLDRNTGKTDKEDFYKDSGKKIHSNSDGSRTIPKGFVLNRVGSSKVDVNKSGVLYCSSNKDDTARYVKNFGPTLVNKIFGTAHTTVQHLSAKNDLKVASDEQVSKETISFLLKDKGFLDAFNESIYSYAFNDKIDSVSIRDLERLQETTDTNEAKKLAYAVGSMLGNSAYADEAHRYYEAFKKKGFDVIPDIYDKYTGTSKDPMIIINPDKVSMTSKTMITKDVLKDGKSYVKTLEKLKINKIIE